MKKNFLAFFSFLILFLSFSASADTLIFTTEDAPPFNFLKEDKKTLTGIGTNIIEEMLNRSGVQASIAVYPWQRAYQMAVSDKNTCVFSTTKTLEREPLFKWVGPIIQNNWILYGKGDTKITLPKLEDAKSFKIGGYNGDVITIFLKSQGFNVDVALNDTINVMKLDAGRVDLWAAGGLSGPYLASKLKIKVKPLITFKETEMHLACNLSVPDDAIEKMNAVIKTMQKDGTFDKINGQYRD